MPVLRHENSTSSTLCRHQIRSACSCVAAPRTPNLVELVASSCSGRRPASQRACGSDRRDHRPESPPRRRSEGCAASPEPAAHGRPKVHAGCRGDGEQGFIPAAALRLGLACVKPEWFSIYCAELSIGLRLFIPHHSCCRRVPRPGCRVPGGMRQGGTRRYGLSSLSGTGNYGNRVREDATVRGGQPIIPRIPPATPARRPAQP